MDNLTPLIIESAQLLLIGMGTVFVILTLLIFLITITSKLLVKFADEPAPTYAHAGQMAKQHTPQYDNELVAVISTAIKIYKKKHDTH